MKMKKIFALILALVMALGLVACGQADAPAADDGAAGDGQEVYTLKVAGSGIDNHTDFMLKKFEEMVEEKSGGRLQVDYYPNLQLGSIREYYEGCQQGQIQMAEGGIVTMANFTKKLDFLSLPMLFDNRNAVQEFVKSDVGHQLMIDVAEETNLYLMILAENGFQVVSNNEREIRMPEDMKGLKIRTQENPILLQIYSQLGADPTPLAYSELFTALQQGTVDGQVNPAVVMATTPIAEVQTYVSDTNLMYDMISVAINYDFYKSLPDDLRAILDECATEAWTAELEYCAADYMGKLEEQGMTIHRLTDDERAAFKTALEPVYDWFNENYDEPNLDKYLEAIAAANEATK